MPAQRLRSPAVHSPLANKPSLPRIRDRIFSLDPRGIQVLFLPETRKKWGDKRELLRPFRCILPGLMIVGAHKRACVFTGLLKYLQNVFGIPC